jgi:hypothetical protein
MDNTAVVFVTKVTTGTPTTAPGVAYMLVKPQDIY